MSLGTKQMFSYRPPVEPYENHVKLPTLISVKPYTVKDSNLHSPVETVDVDTEEPPLSPQVTYILYHVEP